MFLLTHKIDAQPVRHETSLNSIFQHDCIFFLTANDWVISNKELTEKTRYTITGLSPGCKILVRVKAVNAAGASAPRTLQHAILVKEVVGELFKVHYICSAVTLQQIKLILT